MKYLITFVRLLWILTFVTAGFYMFVRPTIVEFYVLPLALVIISVFIIYYAFENNAVFTLEEYEDHLKKVSFEASEKKTESEEQDIITFDEIIIAINDNDLYKDTDFNINQLSHSLNIPAYKITAIYKANGTTFYEEVKKLRVEQAKNLLMDENCNFSIEGIAYEVGFRSRASFYRAFQKYEEKDPSELANNKE